MSVWHRALIEPPRPRSIAARSNAHWYVVGTVCLGAFIGQLDASIVTLALPTLAREFRAPLGGVEWVALAYLLVLIGTVTVVGRLADSVGRKLLYVYGFGVFIAGSALCGLSPSLGWLIAARVLQGAGAVMLQANSVALIVQSVPRKQLGRAIGVQGAAQALGLAAGPALGGLLIEAGGWRLIFFVNVPVGLAGLVLGWFLLPRSRDLQPVTAFDWLGAGLLVPSVAALLIALSEASRAGWSSPSVGVLGVLTVGLVTGFIVRERRTAAPLVDLGLFRRVTFSAGIAAGLLSYLVMFGVLFLVPIYLEVRRHHGAAEVGLELTVLPAALAIAAVIGGRLADRWGARLLTVVGMITTAAGLALLAGEPHGIPARLAALTIIGIGLGAFTPANNAAIMSGAPRGRAGSTGGLLNMTRGLGTALGVAVTGLVYTVAGGTLPAQRGGTRAFVVALVFLALIASGATAISALRGDIESAGTAKPERHEHEGKRGSQNDTSEGAGYTGSSGGRGGHGGHH